mgnify:FL=1
MTAGTDVFISRRSRRRATGAVLLVGLWLKVFVIALGLAQTAQAAAGNDVSPEQDLLAALHVICTSGGVKVLQSFDGDGGDDRQTAGMDLLDCARCCCTPVHGVGVAQHECLVRAAAPAAVLPAPPSLAAGQGIDMPGNPRAPPVQAPT